MGGGGGVGWWACTCDSIPCYIDCCSLSSMVMTSHKQTRTSCISATISQVVRGVANRSHDVSHDIDPI